jgi:hypothetical protein
MRKPDRFSDDSLDYAENGVARLRDTKAELVDGKLVIKPPDETAEHPKGNPFGPPGPPIDPNDIVWPEAANG